MRTYGWTWRTYVWVEILDLKKCLMPRTPKVSGSDVDSCFYLYLEEEYQVILVETAARFSIEQPYTFNGDSLLAGRKYPLFP